MQLGNQHELGYKDFWIRLRVSSTGGEVASFFSVGGLQRYPRCQPRGSNPDCRRERGLKEPLELAC